jgi:hypothetical protein
MFRVYLVVCNVLEADDRLIEAVECFRTLKNKLSKETSTLDERRQGELGE